MPPTVMSHGAGSSSRGPLSMMVTEEPRFPVKVTVRAARADGSVATARRREAVDEGSFMAYCGRAAQAATQHSMSAGSVKLFGNCGNGAK